MKKSLLLILSIWVTGATLAQTTLTLQPDGATMKDAMIRSLGTQYGDYLSTSMHAWTNGGQNVMHRTLLEFDLSSIDSGSTVTDATLYLYGDPTNNDGNSQLNGSDACHIRRITSSWEESTVLWSTMPSASMVNEVSIAASTTTYEDYTADISALVQDMVNDPANSYGMMIQLQTETKYRSRQFASSDVSDNLKRPKLIVNYTPYVGVVEHKDNEFNSYVYPNPFDKSAVLKFDNSTNDSYTVEIVNIVGRKVGQINHVKSGEVVLNRDNLKDGIYFYRLKNKGLVVNSGRFIIR